MINATTTPATSAETFNRPTGEQVAEEKICVQCGTPTTTIPRCDYTIADNRENDFPFPIGGYICETCDENIYREAHLDGELYCPDHGFIESYLNVKDKEGEFVGCFDGCPAALEYDREITAEENRKNHESKEREINARQ